MKKCFKENNGSNWNNSANPANKSPDKRFKGRNWDHGNNANQANNGNPFKGKLWGNRINVNSGNNVNGDKNPDNRFKSKNWENRNVNPGNNVKAESWNNRNKNKSKWNNDKNPKKDAVGKNQLEKRSKDNSKPPPAHWKYCKDKPLNNSKPPPAHWKRDNTKPFYKEKSPTAHWKKDSSKPFNKDKPPPAHWKKDNSKNFNKDKSPPAHCNKEKSKPLDNDNLRALVHCTSKLENYLIERTRKLEENFNPIDLIALISDINKTANEFNSLIDPDLLPAKNGLLWHYILKVPSYAFPQLTDKDGPEWSMWSKLLDPKDPSLMPIHLKLAQKDQYIELTADCECCHDVAKEATEEETKLRDNIWGRLHEWRSIIRWNNDQREEHGDNQFIVPEKVREIPLHTERMAEPVMGRTHTIPS